MQEGMIAVTICGRCRIIGGIEITRCACGEIVGEIVITATEMKAAQAAGRVAK